MGMSSLFKGTVTVAVSPAGAGPVSGEDVGVSGAPVAVLEVAVRRAAVVQGALVVEGQGAGDVVDCPALS